VQRRLRAA
jgi:putative transposase